MPDDTESASSAVPDQGELGNDAIGVVVIARNEGERLKACLRSLVEQQASPIVYVDSGSTDGSVEFARSVGVSIVDLDLTKPFTMARARNAGLEWLLERFPDLAYVHFVDGDCQVEPGWMATALQTLQERPEITVVTGLRRERYPEASIYNRLINMEWNAPTGEVTECGGDALYRTETLRRVGAFNPHMIAGEEPELCARIRLDGGRILRLPVPMTIHDAGLHHFAQWWKRVKRGGHAFAEGAALHGRSKLHHNVKPTLSALLYGLALPASALVGVPIAGLLGKRAAQTVLAVHALPYARVLYATYRSRIARGDSSEDAWLYAAFCTLGKFPEAAGVVTYVSNALRGRHTGLMEYK